MAEVGIRALQRNASAVVAAAAAGETVTITDRGQAVAQLTETPTSTLQRMLGAGRARPPRHEMRDLPPPEPGPDVSAALAKMRDAERF